MTPQQSEVDVPTDTNNNNNNTTVTNTIKTTKTRIKTKAHQINDSVAGGSTVASTSTKTTTKTKKLIKTATQQSPPPHPRQSSEKLEVKIDGNDTKFLERVFAAMKSSQSKPPPAPTIHKCLNGTLSTNGGSGRPPPHPTSNAKKLPSAAMKLPSDLSSSHQNPPCVNGYAEGVPLSTSSTGNNNNNKFINIFDDDKNVDAPVVAVTLTLPLSTTDKMSTTSSKYNYLSGSGSSAISNIERRYSNGYLLQRSPSPSSSVRSSSSRCSSITSTSTRSSKDFAYTPPRRVFPQTYTRGSGSIDVHELQKLESSPVIFDANMSFVLGCKKQPVHQTFRPTPSHLDDSTSSAYLSEKIQNFLRRTDHVQEEWTAMGRRSRSRRNGSINSRDTTPTNSLYDDYDTISLIERQRERKSMERSSSLGRSKSAQNILTKAFQLSQKLPNTPTSRSNSLARDVSEDDDDRTIHEEDDDLDFDEVKMCEQMA